MPTIDHLLRAALREASDVLVLEPGERPRLRRNGSELLLGSKDLDETMIHRLVDEVAPAGNGSHGRRQFDYTADGITFRFTELSRQGAWGVTALAAPHAALAGDPAAKAASSARAAAPAPPASPVARGGAVRGDLPAQRPDPGDRAAEAAPTRPEPVPAPVEFTRAAEGTGWSSLGPLLEMMVERDASDLHLSSEQPPRLRIDGDLDPIPGGEVLGPDRLKAWLYEITPRRNREEFEERNDTDFAYELPGRARFRVNLFCDRHGIGGVIRRIPERVPTADELDLPKAVRSLAYLSKGLVLVTGPTGSGKSTTLAALVDLVNQSRRDHIITIEDPIEFVHPSKGCLVHQREVATHTASFKQALRAALREDPDVILVGELRDLETASIAIETAETGHLVFGTLHTTTAPSTVERLVDQFPGDRQGQIRMMLADSLRAVIAQTLLKRVGGGRVAAFEVLISTPAIANLIREGKIHQITSAMQTGRGLGMTLQNESLCELVQQGIVEPKEAYLKAVYKDTLLHRLRNANVKLDFLDQVAGAAAREGQAPPPEAVAGAA
jgi:twitching motility protein PilT